MYVFKINKIQVDCDAHLNRSKNCLSLCSISSINSFHPIKIKAVRMVLKSIFRYSIILFLNKLSDTNNYLCTILHIMTSMHSVKYLILTYLHFLKILIAYLDVQKSGLKLVKILSEVYTIPHFVGVE